MNDNPQNRHRGEAVIGRAFRHSLFVILIAAIGVLSLLWYRHTPEAPAPAPEAVLQGPFVKTADTEVTRRPPALAFRDVTAESGIDFQHVNGAYGEKLMPETMGSGLAFLDYDNDGDPDLLLVNSDYWPEQPGEDAPRLSLYRNDGSGHFEDVSVAAGLGQRLYGMGVAVADYDADGWRDLYITTLGENVLYQNRNGVFHDVTASAGVAGLEQDWSTGAAFFDADGDSDLDLYVANYVEWSRRINLEIDFRLSGLGRAYGAPNHFKGANSRLYRNEGQGRFTDISHLAGIQVMDPATERPLGKGLGVVPVDFDRDGAMDLAIANDTTGNFLFRNLGDGRFEEIGALEGLAFDRDGKATGAMGIDAARFRNDRELGIAIGNFANEMSSLFVTADGQSPFADEAILEGFGPASRLALTFGLFFFDADLDGRLDLFQANGHLENQINRVQPSQTYAQPAQLFWNCGDDCDNRFIQVEGGGDLNTPMVARGAAYADMDGDGDLDIAVLQNGRGAVLLRNDQKLGHHWLRVRLKGRGANPDAIGARLELRMGEMRQYRQVMPTRSYLSQMELPVTFGLGGNDRVDELLITWPDGQQQRLKVDAVDTTLRVEQAAS